MIRVLLLGEPVLLRDQEEMPPPTWRWQTALLAHLARSPGGAATREALAGLLWPESVDAAARLSLRQALFRLRRALGEVVRAEGDSVSLHPTLLHIDVLEFEALLEAGDPAPALELYRGDFLAGFSLPGNPAFDHWADRERATLAARAARAFEALVEDLSARGEWRAALSWTQRWLAAAPFSERAVGRLIALLAQSGDRGSALAAFHDFRSRLEAELGVAPGPELDALVSRIRRSATSGPDPVPAARSDAPRAEAPFVGRSLEFARLSARWQRACGGRRQFALVTGEAGIGKTRLVTEFAEWARLSGATVLTGRAYEVEGGAIPYAALVGALRPGLDAPGMAAVDARALGELGRILPELADRFAGAPVPAGDDAGLGRLRLLDAVRQMVDNLAYEAPVLLVLDDLPWSDAATVAVLHYLWRTLPDAPFFLLSTARSGDLLPESAAGRLVAALLREDADDVESIELPLLGPEEVERIIAALDGGAAGDAAVTLALTRATGGNPLFLLEALRARGNGDGPIAATTTIRVVVQDRLKRLSPQARALLAAAAVLGRRFPLPTAAAVGRLARSDAQEALAQLVDARIVHQVGYGYDFVHDLVRGTVYADLGPTRRVTLHARAYERLSPAPDEAVGLERAGALAMHAAQGELREQGFRWLLRASELATRAYADVEAERYLAQAVAGAATAVEQAEAWERMGDLHRIRSRFVESARDYLRALAHAPPGSPERLRLRIRALDASVRAGVLGSAEVEEIAAELVPEVTACGGAPVGELHAVLAHAGIQAGDLGTAAHHAAATVRSARGGEPQPLVRALLLHARLGVATGAATDALAVLEEAARLAAEHALVVERSQAEIERANELMRLGRWAEAARDLTEVLQRAAAAGDISSEVTASLNLGDLLLRRGEWDAAEALFQQVATVGRRFPHLLLYVQLNRALMAWLRGAPREMARLAGEVAADAPALGFRPVELLARALGVVGLLEAGEQRQAEERIRELGDADTSTLLFWPMDREMVVLARARAALHAGDAPAAIHLLERGVAEVRDRYGAAVLELDLAAILAAHDPTRAEHLLAAAESSLRKLGALPLLERAQAVRAARTA